jgi:hypothetical protein
MATGNGDADIRIGDQVESGPYLHASVGGAFLARNGKDIILTANDDKVWQDEAAGYHSDYELEVLWRP